MKNFQALVCALLLGMLLGPFNAFSNGLVIDNLDRDSTAQTITFDIGWNNSWRVDSSGSPYNWDAAWVFVKFRECGAASTTPWSHAKIDTASGDNIFSGLQPHATTGGGFYADSNGVMLRRPTNGIFPNAGASTVTLKIDNISPTGEYDVKVFAIEMVYIVEESFYLGISDANYKTFNDGAGNPQLVSSEVGYTQYSANTNNSNWQYANAVLPDQFPKGYQDFYCMKYEITEGQYAAFLNTITSPAQLNRYPGNYNAYRNRLNNNGTPPNIYVAERPDRAQNWLSFHDLASYLDWACLRPMTEMEFEKICRGSAPSVTNEYAWGTNTYSQAQTISTSPEDGTETIFSPTDANVNYSNYTYSGGDAGQGPLRVGIYAKPTSNSRIGTGASFYGVMEMSGNMPEYTIDYRTTTYDGVWGDGYITTAGLYDVVNWPTGGSAFVWRGGSYEWPIDRARVSDRYYDLRTEYTTRYRYLGGRGLR